MVKAGRGHSSPVFTPHVCHSSPSKFDCLEAVREVQYPEQQPSLSRMLVIEDRQLEEQEVVEKQRDDVSAANS